MKFTLYLKMSNGHRSPLNYYNAVCDVIEGVARMRSFGDYEGCNIVIVNNETGVECEDVA